MNVLIVDEEVPWPLDTGKKIRTYNLLQRLQKRHSVTYLCYGDRGDCLPDCPNVTLITLPSTVLEQKGFRFYRALLANMLSPKPYVVDRHYSAALEKRALSLVASGRFDLVHCEWMPYTENIRTLLGRLPSVLSAHNVEAQIWERYCEAESNLLKKLYIYLQWRKMVGYEARAAVNYSQVSVVSAPDRDIFMERYGCSRVTVVPNGVDERYFAPAQSAICPGSMVFTGSMDWRPNQDGVTYFIEEIFPQIRRRIPAATFAVVGRKPPQWLLALAERTPGVTVTGTVDDVRPYIARSMLYVVPLRVGGGSRLKILEAMSMAKTVLSTTVGAEGLDVAEGKNILLRDTPRDFADAACTALENSAVFSGYGAAGRALILESYTWDAIAGVMDAVWERARA
ncbi:glycosyltransferase [Geobacter sp. FeAm09]|uniref:glycosyltransferase n=1 Tax=Geobacter sp. FeAm09 TaxID=2597769 RepID=UPI0011EC72CB|nr:glycosyltransferase [Geobacter sp. FeAm09]QEM68669.1 glycosyltransferase [Geobacter sp. FeAm09]